MEISAPQNISFKHENPLLNELKFWESLEMQTNGQVLRNKDEL